MINYHHTDVDGDSEVEFLETREESALETMMELGIISGEEVQGLLEKLIEYEAVEARHPNDCYWFERPEAVALEPAEPEGKAKWEIFLRLSRWLRENDGSLDNYRSGLYDAIQLARITTQK